MYCDCISYPAQSEATASSHQLFPDESYSHPSNDSLGDVAVKTLSEMVLNDQPAQDPRWGDSRGGSGSSHGVVDVYIVVSL